MITRAIPIHEDAIRDIEKLGEELLYAGDIRASILLTLALAWQYAPEVKPAFTCNVDESAGLAELYALDPHSRRVPAA